MVPIGEGAGTVDPKPYGGTHVHRTGEIGVLRIVKGGNMGRRNRRVLIESS